MNKFDDIGFYFITDSELSKNKIYSDVENALKAGCRIIQYREKKKSTKDMIEDAKLLKKICDSRAIFLVDDRVDIALAVDADGVHIGQEDIPFETARKLLGNEKINILMISQSVSEANISLVIQKNFLERAINTLEIALLGREFIQEVISEDDVCVVAVLGAGMKGMPGVASKIFSAVARKGINVRMIAQGSSELNVSFVVKEKDGARTIQAIHKEFKLSEK